MPFCTFYYVPKIKIENTGFKIDIAKHIKVMKSRKNSYKFQSNEEKKYEATKIELPNFMDIF